METTNAIQRADAPESSIITILDKAIGTGTSPETIERLLAVYERAEALRARKAFAVAMADFKRNCPAIQRRTTNNQFKTVNRDGVSVPRKYASLEDIMATVGAPLAAAGLSVRWGDSSVSEGKMTIECIVEHVDGHSVSSSMSLPVDSKAGCSEQQKYGSAQTYAMRYSVIQALGLTTCDEDDDANLPETRGVTQEQVAELLRQIAEVKGDKDKLIAHFKIASLDEMTTTQYAQALKIIEARRAKHAGT